MQVKRDTWLSLERKEGEALLVILPVADARREKTHSQKHTHTQEHTNKNISEV